MKHLLEEIADVTIGLTLRGKDASSRDFKEGVHLLRISDISLSGEIQIDSPNLVGVSRESEKKYRILPNDILVANRGSRMTAAIVNAPLNAIAGGQLFAIRIKPEFRVEVHPGFLHWFLNHEQTQLYFLSIARGSYIKTVSVKQIRKMKIEVPSIGTQKKIIGISELVAREQKLSERLSEVRQQYFNTLMFRKLNEG